MARETDEKLHDDLMDRGYKQSTTDPNRYWKSNQSSGYDEVDTDDDWYRKDKNWEKHRNGADL